MPTGGRDGPRTAPVELGATGTGYRPASDTVWGGDGAAWTLTGGQADATAGLGLRAYLLDSATDEMTVTIQADSLRLLYAVGPDRGSMEITIDGAVVEVVDTYATVAAGGKAWAADELGAGPHVVRVRAVGTAEALVQPVLVEGILDGDATSGVRVWEAGHSGYGSTHFVQQRGRESSVAQADPELVIIELGTNDYTFQLTGAQFEANLTTIIDRVQAAVDGRVSIALMSMFTTARGATRARYAPLLRRSSASPRVRPGSHRRLPDRRQPRHRRWRPSPHGGSGRHRHRGAGGGRPEL